MSMQGDDGPYDGAPFLCNSTYRVRISVRMSSNAVRTMTSLFDTSGSRSLVSKDFILRARRKSIKTIKSSLLHTSNRKVVYIERIVLLFVRMADLHVAPGWSGRQSCSWCVTWEVVYRSLYLGNIPIREKKSSCNILHQYQFYRRR